MRREGRSLDGGTIPIGVHEVSEMQEFDNDIDLFSEFSEEEEPVEDREAQNKTKVSRSSPTIVAQNQNAQQSNLKIGLKNHRQDSYFTKKQPQ